jgi:hypothetical protein
MTNDMNDILKRSVTEGDYNKSDGGFSVLLGPASWGSQIGLLAGVKGANGLPPYTSKSADIILSETPFIENMWASALNTAITKQCGLGFTIEDDSESNRRIKQAQQLLINFDGRYTQGLSKHLRDYLTTDNGAFIEIVRQSNARGSKVIGLRHLDSIRCFRTGDPQKPVVYMDMSGKHHLLNDYDVVMMSDMPSPRTEYRGYGICAARRAFEVILKMTAIETYVREKVSGSRNLAIHIVNGITAQQLEGALVSTDNATKGKGFVVYKGSTIIPMIKDEQPSVVTIPLAEIPDGFNADSERKDAYLRYANALGVFVGEIQPLSGQGLGTGQQAVVGQEVSEGRGLASWRKAFAHAVTHEILPDQTSFNFAVSDTKDKKDRADALNAWAGALKTLIDTQTITAQQALNVLVDNGELPREFLQQDGTSGGIVTDNENVTTNGEREIDIAGGQTLQVQSNAELRSLIQKLRTKSKRMTARSYRNSETWNPGNPSTELIPFEQMQTLLSKTARQSKRLVSDVL